MGDGAGFLDRFPVVALRRRGVFVVRVVAQMLDVGARVGAFRHAAGAAVAVGWSEWSLAPPRAFACRKLRLDVGLTRA